MYQLLLGFDDETIATIRFTAPKGTETTYQHTLSRCV